MLSESPLACASAIQLQLLHLLLLQECREIAESHDPLVVRILDLLLHSHLRAAAAGLAEADDLESTRKSWVFNAGILDSSCLCEALFATRAQRRAIRGRNGAQHAIHVRSVLLLRT